MSVGSLKVVGLDFMYFTYLTVHTVYISLLFEKKSEDCFISFHGGYVQSR
jgi:hypothetical protein